MRKFVFAAIAVLTFSAAAAAVDFDTRACLSPTSTVFVSGMQRWVRMKDSKSARDEGADKTRFTPFATAIGYEYAVQNWSAGLSMSYETGTIRSRTFDSVDTLDTSIRLRDRTLGFTLFGTYRFGDGYYAKASAFAGFASQKLKRGRIIDDRLASDGTSNSTRWAASVELGKSYEISAGFRMTPHVGLDYSHTPSKAVSYRDEFYGWASDEYKLRSMNVWEVPLGVTFAKDYAFGCDWVVTPSVDLTMITRFGHISHDNRNTRPGFASRTGSEWKVYGAGAGSWGGRITTGVKAVKSERFDLDLNYAYEGRKKYSDHRISLSAGFSF